MTLKLRKLSILIIAAVMLVAMAFAGAASAAGEGTKDNPYDADGWNFLPPTFSTPGTIYIADADTTHKIYSKTSATVSATSVTLDFSGYKGTFEGYGPETSGDTKGALFDSVTINSGNTLNITGLTMTSVNVTSSGTSIGGIIGYVDSSGTLNFTSCNLVNCSVGGTSSGEKVGGLVGFANSASVNVKDCSVMHCDVVSGSHNVGGLVGYVKSANFAGCNVTNSTVASTGSDFVGGLVGYADSASFEACGVENASVYADSGTVGGLVGCADTGVNKIKDCLVKNCVVASTGSSNVGGLVGGCASSANDIGKCHVVNCTMSGISSIGGLVGYAESASGWSGNEVKNCAVNSTATLDWDTNYVCGNKPEMECSANCSVTGNNFIKNGTITDTTITPTSSYGWNTIQYVTANGTTKVTNLGIYGEKGGYGVGSYEPSGPTLATYVEVSTWEELSNNISVWTNTEEARTVAVTRNIDDRDAGDDTEGIMVKGKIILMPIVSPKTGSEVVIDGKGLGRLFYVNGGNLTLCGNGTSATLNLTGGNTSLIPISHSKSGGAVLVDPCGNLTLNTGVMITNCSATKGSGGGVYVYETCIFTMNGGSISDCKATISGGGVFNCGKFILTGGSITDCTASRGGGVNVEVGRFTMAGGKISGCTATNTTDDSAAGGVSFNYGKFYVKGDATVTDNNRNGVSSNVAVSNASLTLNGTFTGSIGITPIGVSTVSVGDTFGIAGDDADGADGFFADADETLVGSISDTKLVWKAAGPAPQYYNVTITNATKSIKLSNQSNTVYGDEGFAKALKDGDTVVLTLNNFKVNKAGCNIINSTAADLKIVLNGDSNLTGSIKSSGKLTIVKGEDGSELVVNNTASSSTDVISIHANSLTIDNANVTAIANNTGSGIACALNGQNVQIIGSDAVVEANATSAEHFAHSIMANTIKINSSAKVTVTAKTEGNSYPNTAHGLYDIGGNIIVSDSAEVIAVVNSSKGRAYAISDNNGGITIDNAKVTAIANGKNETFAIVSNFNTIQIIDGGVVDAYAAASSTENASAIITHEQDITIGSGAQVTANASAFENAFAIKSEKSNVSITGANTVVKANATSNTNDHPYTAFSIVADGKLAIDSGANVSAGAHHTGSGAAISLSGKDIGIADTETVIFAFAETESSLMPAIAFTGNNISVTSVKKLTAIVSENIFDFSSSFGYNISGTGSLDMAGLAGYTFSNAIVSGAEPKSYATFIAPGNWHTVDMSILSNYTAVTIEKKDTPTPTPSYSGSTKQTGYTQIVQNVPTTTPTVAPTAAPTQAPVTPTAKSTTQATTQPTQSSPAPVAGLIAGLGAAALVLVRMRR